VWVLLGAIAGCAADSSPVDEGPPLLFVRQRGVWVAEACKRHGFRYGPRLHIDLYGHTRGT